MWVLRNMPRLVRSPCAPMCPNDVIVSAVAEVIFFARWYFILSNKRLRARRAFLRVAKYVTSRNILSQSIHHFSMAFQPADLDTSTLGTAHPRDLHRPPYRGFLMIVRRPQRYTTCVPLVLYSINSFNWNPACL